MARIRGHTGHDRQRSQIKHYKMPQKDLRKNSGGLFVMRTKKKRLHLRSDRIKRPTEQSTVFGSCGAAQTSVFQIKVPNFVSLRGRKAAAAILKLSVWYPGAKQGSTKQQNSEIFDPFRRDTTMAPLALYHAASAALAFPVLRHSIPCLGRKMRHSHNEIKLGCCKNFATAQFAQYSHANKSRLMAIISVPPPTQSSVNTWPRY